jgi:beta-phosphoglucomutase-like phosphatase (HAD superfamily)
MCCTRRQRFHQGRSGDCAVAIASGALRHEIDEILEAAGLAPIFTCIVRFGRHSGEQAVTSPLRLAFDRLCSATGGRSIARGCVAIEDSKWGLESAWAAGLRCVGVTTSYGAEDLPRASSSPEGSGHWTLAALDALVAADAEGPR